MFYAIALLFVCISLDYSSASGNTYNTTQSITNQLSIQRGTQNVTQLSIQDAFFWNYTLQDSKGRTIDPPFCVANASVINRNLREYLLIERFLDDNSVLSAVVMYQYYNSPDKYPLNSFYIIDSFLKKLIFINATISVGTVADNSITAPNTLESVSLPDSNSINWNYTYLVKIDNSNILAVIGNRIVFYGISQTVKPTLKFKQDVTDGTYFKDLEYYNGTLYTITDGNKVILYSVNLASGTITLTKTLNATSFPGTPNSINPISLAINKNNQFFYLLDSMLGIFIVDISAQNKIVALKTNVSLTAAKSLYLSDKGILFVSFANLLTQIVPDGADLKTSTYVSLYAHTKIPSSGHFKSLNDIAFVSYTNIIEIFKYGIPQSYSINATGLDVSAPSPGVQLIYPFYNTPDNQTLLLMYLDTVVMGFYSITVSPPTLTCNPPKSTSQETYSINSQIFLTDCQEKQANSDNSSLSICQQAFIIKVDVWDDLIKSTKVALAIGLSIGLFFFFIALGLCIYFWRKTKHYEKLKEESKEKGDRVEIKNHAGQNHNTNEYKDDSEQQHKNSASREDQRPVDQADIQLVFVKGNTKQDEFAIESNKLPLQNQSIDDIYGSED